MTLSDHARRTIRTGLQTGLGLAVALPLIVDASGIPEATPGVGLALAVAAGAARVMALPAVDRALPPWLRKAARDGDLDQALRRRE